MYYVCHVSIILYNGIRVGPIGNRSTAVVYSTVVRNQIFCIARYTDQLTDLKTLNFKNRYYR